MYFNKRYRVDGDKIETVEDVAKVIDALDIRIGPDHDSFEELEPYLTETERENKVTYD